MKILEQTENILKLRHKTPIAIILIAVLFGTAFSGFGLLGILSNEKATLNCQRTEPDLNYRCKLTNSTILNTETKTLTQIETAQIDRDYVSGTRGRPGHYVYGIILVTKTEPVTVSGLYTSDRESMENKINEINNFLDDPNRLSVTVTQNYSLMFFIGGGIFLLVGSLFLILVFLFIFSGYLQTIFIFDKTTKQLQVKGRKIFGTVVKKYQFSEIEKIFLKTKKYQDKDGDINKKYIFKIKLKSGKVQAPVIQGSRDRLEPIINIARGFIQEK